MTDALSLALTRALVASRGLNEFLDAALEAAGRALGVERLAIYDYHEDTGRFDLLYFHGYPAGSRSGLRRQMLDLDLRRGLEERDPRPAGPGRLLVPLYFQEVLEAVLLVEGFDGALGEAGREACRVISRFLGLFLSSSRLAINRKSEGRGELPASDLERARQIQLAYLPDKPLLTDYYEVYGYNASSAIVGGDYFDFFENRPGSFQCVLADACGHGLAAALIMSTFRGLLRAQIGSGEDLFNRLNRQIYTGTEFVQFLTGVFLDYERESRSLRYFNAGHFDPLLVNRDGAVTALSGGGPPLGILRGFEYPMRSGVVSPGDLMVLYTDGLAELEDAGRRQFGAEGILGAVVPRRGQPLQDVASEVLSRAAEHHGGPHAEDDLTLVLVRFG